jgi:uncharacterized membrane protein
VGLVLASALLHAWWNFVLKRSGGGALFVGLSKGVEVVLLAPAFLWWGVPGIGGAWTGWPLVLGGAALTLASYAALSRAYTLGELSVVYPVARGGLLLFVPVLGYAFLGERLTGRDTVGICAVGVGIVVLQLPALTPHDVRAFVTRLAHPATTFALLAAAASAGYTVWDTRAVRVLPAFTYLYAYTAVVAVVYGGVLLRTHTTRAIRAELTGKRWALVQVALGNAASYLLVLLALRGGTSGHVVAVRQVSIAVGAVLGWRLLGEAFGATRRLGVALIVLGCVLLAASR